MKTKTAYAVQAYDLLYANHVRHYRNSIASLSEVLGGQEPDSVLAVACGTGIELLALKPLGWESRLYGFDLEPEFAEVAHANLVEEGLQAEVWAGDALTPGFNGHLPSEGVGLITFRGNSLGHFGPDQYEVLFQNLFAALKPGGKLVFDFRDGEEYFAARKPFEFLGAGRYGKGLFLSYYRIDWPKSIGERYTVTGNTWVVDVKGLRKLPQTRALGVLAKSAEVLSSVESAGFDSCLEVTEVVGQSLNHLRTFVATKGGDENI
jgi:SAM-dependent methyltransferase